MYPVAAANTTIVTTTAAAFDDELDDATLQAGSRRSRVGHPKKLSS